MKKYKKIIINSVFVLIPIIICVLCLIDINYAYNAAADDFDVQKYLIVGVIYTLLMYGPISFFSYCILWRSTYHLFTAAPRRICYTVVDVISVIALVVWGILFIHNMFFVYLPWEKNMYGYIPSTVLLVRIVCISGYGIAGMFRKNELPAEGAFDPLDGRSD